MGIELPDGEINYHGVPGNRASLNRFRERLMGYWWHALARRSQRGRLATGRKQQLAARYIPLPVILHPFSQVRLDAKHPSPQETRTHRAVCVSSARTDLCGVVSRTRSFGDAMLYQR